MRKLYAGTMGNDTDPGHSPNPKGDGIAAKSTLAFQAAIADNKCTMEETDLEQEVESWNPYRRAFNKEHRVVFDVMMEHARKHFPEAVASEKRIPIEAIIMGILIEQDKEIQDLKRYRF